jgi:addiction module RelE/StbE family toxin
MTYSVEFSTGAKQDLFKIYRYIKNDGKPQTTKKFSGQIKKACFSLSENPERGYIPAELKGLGVMWCRQIVFKNYRIIYQVIGKVVVISGIIDGHRQIREVMRQRMLP